MTDLPKARPVPDMRSINWYWIAAFLSMALLGVLLDSAISPESMRSLGNPLTSVGIWGAVFCVLFLKEKAQPGHPQTGMVLTINGRFAVVFLLLMGHIAVSFCFGSAITTLVLGDVVFLVSLIFRCDYNTPVSGSVSGSVGGSPWFVKQCRICGELQINSYDLAFTNDPERHVVTHCHRCGTNCEGPITQPLTPTAQEILDGGKAEPGCGSLIVAPSQIPPDPLPFPCYEYSKLIGPIILLIFAFSFLSEHLIEGPYLVLKLLFVLSGITWFVLATRTISQTVKADCPHCQANLFALARRLRRSIRYRKKDGHYVLEAEPRYCPFCGKDIEEPVAKR